MKMKKKWLLAVIIFLLIIAGAVIFIQSFFTLKPVESDQNNSVDFVQLQSGYAIEVFADNLGPQKVSTPGPNNGVRMLEHKDGIFYATVPAKGEVVTLHDQDGDWKIEERTTFLSGLKRPHGIAIHNDDVYIAEEDQVFRVKDTNNDGIAEQETIEHLVDLPEGSHWTRTVKIFNDEMYISIGSTCNVCKEEHPWRAAIVKCKLDGSNCAVFASGLRNSVDMELHEGKIWATENGRDQLGNDVPPEEINIIEEGKDFGWPICFGKQIHDSNFDKNTYIRNPCLDTEPSYIDMQAHSAPLGLGFYEGDLLVAFHGSWNRDPPTGYKVVRIDLETQEIEDFAMGWLDEEGSVHGRPVDILVVGDSILVSDDVAGKIYRIYRE